jgi:hypothetical protein
MPAVQEGSICAAYAHDQVDTRSRGHALSLSASGREAVSLFFCWISQDATPRVAQTPGPSVAFCGARQTPLGRTNSARPFAATVAGLLWKHFPTPPEPGVVIGTFRVVEEPACRANETAREAKTTSCAKATFAKMFDMGENFHDENLLERRIGLSSQVRICRHHYLNSRKRAEASLNLDCDGIAAALRPFK